MWPTCFCFFASAATEKLSSVGNMAYNSNWYDYPVGMQKHMVLIIARSQEPVYFSGLSLIRCTVETFGKVRFCLHENLQNNQLKKISTLFSAHQVIVFLLFGFSKHFLRL